MSEDTYLIVGLGNPGSKYDATRHNIGFMVVDEIARLNNCPCTIEKWESLSSRSRLWSKQVCLVKPQTYMNLSGKAVARFMQFYKLEPAKIIVVHDDLDMKVGRLKLVKGGGAGGHNGIRSMIQCTGTKDFFRLKVGIGRPGQGDIHKDFPVEKYVLTSFEKEDARLIEERMGNILDGVRIFLQDGAAKAMGYLNGFK